MTISLMTASCQGEHTSDLQNIQISILTCGPGGDIYSLFGHTALRVNDRLRGRDIVYNWGTFSYGEPTWQGKADFIFNFLKGKLPYALSAGYYERFIADYNFYRRSVHEQVLDLTDEEKSEIFDQLLIHMLPDNRTYAYDFYFDNCVTRPRDVLEQSIDGLRYPVSNDQAISFRGLLHEHLIGHSWTRFGMDIILGMQSESSASIREKMFLPNYFMDYLSQSTSAHGSIVSASHNILDYSSDITESWWTPFKVFSALLVAEILGVFLFFISGDRGLLVWYDRFWFVALSLCMLVFLLMWSATSHTVCYDNWNLLWAGPWVILYFFKNKKVSTLGVSLTLLSSVLVFIGWSIIPQQLNVAIIPLCLVSTMKCIRLLGVMKSMDKTFRPISSMIFILFISLNVSAQKIDGITMVAPPQPFEGNPMLDIREVNADWIALVPFAFSNSDSPKVNFGSKRQWWGERREGIEASIKLAKTNGLKVMLKPQVWIPGGWVGDVDFDNDDDWNIWEESYRQYIMSFMEMAIEYEVDMVCIGTEYRKAVKEREEFWRKLIEDIRKIYDGQLTYSSNWDAYDDVPIWDVLDFIGISAYFPLSNANTPPATMLTYRWKKHISKLKKFSSKKKKKILFTEYGYLSVDGAAGKTWELEKKVHSLDINQEAQANGYEALFRTFWNEDFWAGGFLWKWFPEGKGHEGYPERDYTPQNKEASKVLSKWYGKSR